MRTVLGFFVASVVWLFAFGIFVGAHDLLFSGVGGYMSRPGYPNDLALGPGMTVAFALAGTGAGVVAVAISRLRRGGWLLGAIPSLLPVAWLAWGWLASGPDGYATPYQIAGLVLAPLTGALGGAWEQRRRAARASQVSSERAQ
jgi:hypothetical protein